MRETRLEDFGAHRAAVHVEFIDAQSRGHPLGGDDFALVRDGRDEPAGTVGGALGVAFRHHRCVRSGNPLGRSPGGVVKRFGADAGGGTVLPGTGQGQAAGCQAQEGQDFCVHGYYGLTICGSLMRSTICSVSGRPKLTLAPVSVTSIVTGAPMIRGRLGLSCPAGKPQRSGMP